jgi:hypothetical protein
MDDISVPAVPQFQRLQISRFMCKKIHMEIIKKAKNQSAGES